MLGSLQTFKHINSFVFMLMLVFMTSQALSFSSDCQHQMSHNDHTLAAVTEADSDSQNLHAHHNLDVMNQEASNMNSLHSDSSTQMNQATDCCSSACECAQNTCNSLQVFHLISTNSIGFEQSNLMLFQTSTLNISDFPSSLYRPPIIS